MDDDIDSAEVEAESLDGELRLWDDPFWPIPSDDSIGESSGVIPHWLCESFGEAESVLGFMAMDQLTSASGIPHYMDPELPLLRQILRVE